MLRKWLMNVLYSLRKLSRLGRKCCGILKCFRDELMNFLLIIVNWKRLGRDFKMRYIENFFCNKRLWYFFFDISVKDICLRIIN